MPHNDEIYHFCEKNCLGDNIYNCIIGGEKMSNNDYFQKGFEDGRKKGFEDGLKKGQEEKEGYDEGYKEGHDEGHEEGQEN